MRNFSYIIFSLLLRAKMYYVILNQVIYILIYIISIFPYNSYLSFTFQLNFLPANLLVLVVIFIDYFTYRLTSSLELMLYVL